MSYPGLPFSAINPGDWMRKAANTVNGIMQGRTNNYFSVTLTPNSATTTITFAAGRLSSNSTVLFCPTTANAAAEAAVMYESARNVAAATLTLTHTNDADVDKTFRGAIIG